MATDTNHEDFYELLGISSHASTDAEIRRAYRKTALKYHPDKVGSDGTAAAKFHDLQVAFDVLSDPLSKEAYDNARRAKEARQEREQQFEGRRKQFKDELEARESASLKRKRGDDAEDDAYRREIARLAADGKRRREELTAKLRREQEAEITTLQPQAEVTDESDRSIKLRFRQSAETAHLTQASLTETFSRYGKIEHIVLRDKRIKIPGEKHRVDFTLVTLVFADVVGARAAVNARVEHVDDIGWLKGTEPEVEIPKAATEPVVGLDATLERLKKADIRRREKLEKEKVNDTQAENV
ncbi:hypothetical protein B0A48_16624 [Cryoendolithus antarcticus]|uniref:J domain-containing protein n=1 Tax=Cryoendolithus antarcticus TaxID=1507870 RepID=A0A1V8SE92_9PEZI|nr:hypothetical protein B0A48_16624 [Cryoendolithus antarcticus]